MLALPDACPYVLPAPNDPTGYRSHGAHYGGWTRGLTGAGVPHVGTHGINHWATADIDNFGMPIQVGMKLTGHKTVAMFMHYVLTGNKLV